MPLPTEELRAKHAEAVPVYVRAAADGFELVLTATDEALSTHETPREALHAALERDDVKACRKSPNLRTDGEPDGVWLWLDASAEEDEPIGGSRITAESLWEMAAGLNARASAIPINGGGAPEGYKTSEPHGDAYHGDGAHPANGWAHVAAIVVETDGRTHLYLYGELLPEIAREVERGRLAYGSIFMAFESVDEADNFAVIGAVLISHALTNDPAVTTLTAGSERTRRGLAVRSRRTKTMAQKTNLEIARDASKKPGERARAAITHVMETAARGPISDMLAKVMEALAITESDLATNPWALEDSMYGLLNAAKFEKRIEQNAPPPAAQPPAPGESAAQRQRAVREVQGVDPDQVEPMLESFIALGKEVLGKPDAAPADVLAELEARKAEVGAALGTDTPEDGEEPVETEERAEGEEEDEPEPETAEARAALRATARDAKAKPADRLRAARALAKSNERYETREWLDAEIAKRKLQVSSDKRTAWTELAIAKGREVVIEILDVRNAPPSSNPLEGAPDAKPAPKTLALAADACMEDARAELRSSGHEDPLEHFVRARAQRIAAKRWPDLFGDSQPAA